MEQTITANSESLVLSLCKEIEYIKSRAKNINQSLKYCQNKKLTCRLDIELSKLNEKRKTIKTIAENLFRNNRTDLSTEFLFEITHRTIYIQHL